MGKAIYVKSETIIYGSMATVSVGHVLLFIEPLWGVFTYVGALFLAFGGLITCTLQDT